MNQILFFTLLAVIFLPTFTIYVDSYEIDEIEQFHTWANNHGITLVGVNKNTYDLYYDGYDSQTDNVNWKEVPGVLVAANALYKIPENVLQVMDGKTIYFSTEYGRSYAVLDSFPEHHILGGLNRGIILEQNINVHTVIHEIGHIVDYHGIQGIYNDKQNIFKNSFSDRLEIFNVTSAQLYNSSFVSSYSKVNDAENFAENFAYYVYHPEEFREKVTTDDSLVEEYRFIRDNIFLGFEYAVWTDS